LRANGNEMTNETEAQLSAMLQGISSETGVKYLAYAGSGTFMHTIRCRDSTGELVALKVSKSNRPADRMHNDPAVREAANLIAWQRRTKRTPVRLLLPEPRFLMAGGTSCLGTSKPDAKGFVYSFLLEEFVEGVALTDLVKEHRQLWQETGALTDKLRRTHTQSYHALARAFADEKQFRERVTRRIGITRLSQVGNAASCPAECGPAHPAESGSRQCRFRDRPPGSPPGSPRGCGIRLWGGPPTSPSSQCSPRASPCRTTQTDPLCGGAAPSPRDGRSLLSARESNSASARPGGRCG
jgi:hypothetical protein